MERPVCAYCGKPLHKYAHYEALQGLVPSRYGYKGNGIFCTLRCGFNYGRHMAKVAGRKPA